YSAVHFPAGFVFQLSGHPVQSIIACPSSNRFVSRFMVSPPSSALATLEDKVLFHPLHNTGSLHITHSLSTHKPGRFLCRLPPHPSRLSPAPVRPAVPGQAHFDSLQANH